MNNKNYNSGRIRIERARRSRYIASSFINDSSKSSIAIVASILALVLIVCSFFIAFRDQFSLPVLNFPNIDITLPSEGKDPNHTYVATEGGKGMYHMDLSSQYAILVNLSDMTTIAHKYADEKIFPASMTKVMTVVTALDLIENLDEKYIITREVLNKIPSEASTAWLSNCIGSEVSVRDLLYGISYMSGADSVICIIDYLGLTKEEFVALMNAKALEIGLQNTNFGGAIGMDDEFNQTTCRDIAAIMIYAMQNPLCVELFGGLAYKLDHADMTYYNSTLSKTLNNIGLKPETVLGEDYTLIAAKSGLEDDAGYCLVSYIRNDNTGEYFVLVTAKASRSDAYPPNKNTILDMQEIFDTFAP